MTRKVKSRAPGFSPTVVDVARMAKVGLGTASRALNETGYVSASASKSVLKAAAALGYRRNEVAHSLKVRRSGAIGIVVPDIGGPFMAACVRAAQGILREKNYISILAFTDGQSNVEAAEIRYLLQRQIDGLLVVPAGGDYSHYKEDRLGGTPIVSFDHPLPGLRVDSVLVRNKAGAHTAVQHLLWHGHRRIACFGVNRHLYTIRKRLEGYLQAMHEAGLDEMVHVGESTRESVSQKLGEWLKLKKPPTAIFSLNELTSIYLLEALAEHNVKVPKQVAFVAFDDIQLGRLLKPAVTAMVQPASDLGAQAATLLLKRIDGNSVSEKRRIQLEPELVIRQSCGCTQQQNAEIS